MEVTAGGLGNALPLNVIDCDDGTYRILFRAPRGGRYGVKIEVFDRPVKDSPIYFDVSEHNNPVCTYGSKGSGKDEFLQPVAVVIDENDGNMYVLDTGNSRIKVLDSDMKFVKHVTNKGLEGRSCTGKNFENI